MAVDYSKYPRKEWDEINPIYSPSSDKYYQSYDDLIDDLNEQYEDSGEMRLDSIYLLTQKTEFRKIPYEFWNNDIHEEYEFSDEFLAKLEDFNKFLASQDTHSYNSIRVVAILDEEFLEEQMQKIIEEHKNNK